MKNLNNMFSWENKTQINGTILLLRVLVLQDLGSRDLWPMGTKLDEVQINFFEGWIQADGRRVEFGIKISEFGK